jgi:hypothetical protein
LYRKIILIIVVDNVERVEKTAFYENVVERCENEGVGEE